MSRIDSLRRQLERAEGVADDPDLPERRRRAQLREVERIRNQITELEHREQRKAEERGARASRRW